MGGHAGRWRGRLRQWGQVCAGLCVLWVWRVGAGCAGTVKRGGMYEIIRKVKGHPFPESFEA